MMKRYLNQVKTIYQNGNNIINYLNRATKSNNNSSETIMVSYDFQSGSYIKQIEKDHDYINKYTRAIEVVIDSLGVKYQSIVEVGVGDATTLVNLVPKLKNKPRRIFGFDLAWSRVRYAIWYAKKKGLNNAFLFMGDLFNIPLSDNSIDIVYTSHSIEPNGGREREALLELMRVTRKYLILLEPAYEFSNLKARERIKKNGYVKNLYTTAISLGFDVVEHRLLGDNPNQLNPTGLMVIEKKQKGTKSISNPLRCTITKTPLKLIKNSYFSNKGLLVYPVVDGVPCLLEDNAIIATHFMDDFKK